MKRIEFDKHVVEFKPENDRDMDRLVNLTRAMMKIHDDTVFTSLTASQNIRVLFGIYIDTHVMIEVLERLQHQDVLSYAGVNADCMERFAVK